MKLTPIKLRIIESKWYKDLCKELGEEPPFQQILANRLNNDRRNISPVLNGKVRCRPLQEKIAAEVGISVGKLFGHDAWFRVAAQRLKEREADQLAACSG